MSNTEQSQAERLIIENRNEDGSFDMKGIADDIASLLRSQPTHPVDGELPSIIQLMAEIRKYWPIVNGELELKEFAEYVQGLISSHRHQVHGNLSTPLVGELQKELRRIVTRNGKSACIPEILEDELNRLEQFFTAHLQAAVREARIDEATKAVTIAINGEDVAKILNVRVNQLNKSEGVK